jgi:hypothetical protein
MNNTNNVSQYRIKEQKYKSGISRYTPEGFFVSDWKNLAHKELGFNTNGKNWCNTIEEAKLIIENFKSSLLNTEDEIIEETEETYHWLSGWRVIDNTEDTIFKQMLLVKYNIDALKFGTNIDESRYKGIIKSYDILADMVFKYIEKLKQNENE